MKDDIDHIAKLERFITDSLSPHEREEMEKQLASDPRLQDDLQAMRSVIDGIKGAELKASFVRLQQEINKERGTRTMWYAVAASLAALVFVVYTLIPRTSDKYDAYFEPFPAPRVTRSAESPPIQQVLILYDHGKFEAAEDLFSTLDEQAYSAEMKFYRAQTLLALRKPDEAASILANLKVSSLQEEINWYLALAYLMAGDESKGVQTLKSIQPRQFRHQQAQEILHSLR